MADEIVMPAMAATLSVESWDRLLRALWKNTDDESCALFVHINHLRQMHVAAALAQAKKPADATAGAQA